MEKRQREFLLRQQLEAIKKELGEGDGDVAAEYRKRIEDAGMPDAVRKEVERELDRFERTSEQNPEAGWIRNYLDWMLDMPWNKRTVDQFDVVEARRVLDQDHTGLEDVKDRIIEFLAVRKRRDSRGLQVIGGRGSGAIITLVGPPGVGAARSARPGAEPLVPGSLPRGRPGFVRSPVYPDGQRGGHHPGAAARPDGDHPAGRLHRGREACDRPRSPAEPPARAQRSRC